MYKTFFCILSLLAGSGAFFRGLVKRTICSVIPKQLPQLASSNLPEDLSPNLSQDLSRLHWYVVAEAKEIRPNKPFKAVVWDKEYVIWKTGINKYTALDDRCSHRGASLSKGKITQTSEIICPYHGYEFNQTGSLTYVPGLNYTNTPCQNVDYYNVVERGGWIYINTIPRPFLPEGAETDIYVEPENNNTTFAKIFIKSDFEAYARVVSENSLDVMHIGFVHTFGNKESPSPIKEVPPHTVNGDSYHYRTQYEYKSGKDSLVKRLYKIPKLRIENEFILPHTTIARVIFGDFVSTVVTFATPVNVTNTRLFVKTYRNFWNMDETNNIFAGWANAIGNRMTTKMMKETVNQDKCVIERIPLRCIDGRFNMKFDKLQNVYRTLYKRLVHNATETIIQ
jgi:phenylpropionate dioxygenase-like ring-hydroxylating dioxygenase large terminal subunit